MNRGGGGWVVTGIEAGTEKFNILNSLILFDMAYFCCWFYVVTQWKITQWEVMKLVLFWK